MVIICRDIGCFMLALFYLENLMADFQYKMWIFYQSERRYYPLTPAVFFCTPPLFNFFWNWTKIVFSIRKCKYFAYIVTICRDIRCFMLALVYLENLMGDIQYKMWFSIRVRGGTLPHPQNFSVCLPFSIVFLQLN